MPKDKITNGNKNKYLLHVAVASGKLENVEKVLEDPNYDPNVQQKSVTPLRLSVKQGFWDITRKLLHLPNIKVPVDFLTYAVKENVPTDIVAELVTRSDQVKAFNQSDTLVDLVTALHSNYSHGSKENLNRINNIKLLVQEGGDIYNLELGFDAKGLHQYESYKNVKSKREVVLHLIQEMNNQELTDVFEVARQKISDSIDLMKDVDQYSRLPDDFNEKKLSELQSLVERGTLISTMRTEIRQDYEQYRKVYKPPLDGRYPTDDERKKDIYMKELFRLYNPYSITNAERLNEEKIQKMKKELKHAENTISSISNLIKTLMQNKNISVEAQNLPDQARALTQGLLSPAGPSGVLNSLPSSSKTKPPERNRVI